MPSQAKKDEAYNRLNEKLKQYADPSAAREWLERNQAKIQELFHNAKIRDFVFEPIRGVFDVGGKDKDGIIRTTITTVAVVNMVLAGLPGKMGVGVFVSMALEGWMAWVIARQVGVVIDKPADVWKYFGILASIVFTIVFAFKELLGIGFSLFSFIPGVNPLIFAELFVTNLVGVLFWVGFREAASKGSFTIPWRLFGWIGRETKGLFAFQFNVIRNNLSVSKLRIIGRRLGAWLKGDILIDRPQLRGELLSTAAMAWLLTRDLERFDGPIGQVFIQSIRDRYPELSHASLDQMADRMAQYDPDQLMGVINQIKGKLFERLVELHENADGDVWTAALHEDESYPGSDIIMTNESTGETIELSLKATANVHYLEDALIRYPDIPILTTQEVAEHFGGDPRVMAASFNNEELTEITEENFQQMLDHIAPLEVEQVAGAGVGAKAVATLWPFVIAYLRKKIPYEQLEEAFKRVMGEAGVSLAARVSYAVVFGPVFGWYLLARGVMGLTRSASEGSKSAELKSRRLVWRPRSAI